MKKAFDQNVSRAKPKLRLGSSIPPSEAFEPPPPAPEADLNLEVKARVDRGREPRVPASEAMQRALGPNGHEPQIAEERAAPPPVEPERQPLRAEQVAAAES